MEERNEKSNGEVSAVNVTEKAELVKPLIRFLSKV